MTMALEGGEGSVSCPSRSLPPSKDPVPIAQEAGWALGPVWTGAENIAPTGIRSPDRPARGNQSLYWLSYPGPQSYWTAANSSESQEIPHNLRNLKAHYQVTSPAFVHILSQANSAHALISILPSQCPHINTALPMPSYQYCPPHALISILPSQCPHINTALPMPSYQYCPPNALISVLPSPCPHINTALPMPSYQ